MNVAILKRLLERVGTEEAAKRLRRSPATLKRWIKNETIPEKSRKAVGSAWRRSEGARKAARTRKENAGTPLEPEEAVEIKIEQKEAEQLAGLAPGEIKKRLEDRAFFHREKLGQEMPPVSIFVRVEGGPWDGSIYMIDEEGEYWRMYTIDGKVFWTRAESVSGYYTDDEFQDQYATMQGHEVRLFF